MSLLDLIYNDDSINKLNNHEGRLVINNTLACSYLVSGIFLKKQKNIYSVEEHNIIGGLGDSIAAVVATNNLNCKLKKIGLKDCFAKGYGTYSQIKEMNGLDANSIYNEIMKNIK